MGRRLTNKLPAHQTNFREELEKCCGQAPAVILERPSDPLIFNLAFKLKLIRKKDENEMKRKEVRRKRERQKKERVRRSILFHL